MSIVILKRRFEAPPDRDEILSLLVGDNVGDAAKAKVSLGSMLALMKDLLALYQFMDNLDMVAEKYADLLKEKEAVSAAVSGVKADLVFAKNEFDKATKIQGAALAKVTADTSAQIASLAAQVSELETSKANLAKEIENEQTAKLRLNAAVSAEYDRLRAEMLAKVAEEEKAAKASLKVILPQLEAAKVELAEVTDALSKLTSGGGGDIINRLLGSSI